MKGNRGGGSSQERVAEIMEGRRGDVVTGAVAPQQGRCYYGRHGGGGGSGYESDDGSSGGVELSLRLRTGSSPPPAAAAAAAAAGQQQEAAARRRSMTIFYDGRVCAVDVTEIQAREIISMVNQEILAHQWQQQHREERHVQDRGSTTTTSSAAARCGGGQVRPVASAAGCPRQGLATMATADQSGLSMKRSLQRFLQKREARRAAAAAPPYAAGGRQAQAI